MKTTIIDDDLVIQHLSAAAAIEAVEAALTAQVNGTLTAPARLRATLDDGDLVFTVGAFNEGYGLRVCDTVPTASDDQITVLWSRDGHLRCIVVGPELGRRRTAAIDRLVKVDAQPFIGVLSAGQQAYTQLWAISTLRHITAVQCYRRDAASNEAFAQRLRDELDLAVETSADPEAAVRGCDVLILATGATQPVVEDAEIGKTAPLSPWVQSVEVPANFRNQYSHEQPSSPVTPWFRSPPSHRNPSWASIESCP